MGVGYALDLIVLTALGVDMFDCVYPTRTARFGHALLLNGLVIDVKTGEYQADIRPVDESCSCVCCTNYTRAGLHLLFRTNQSVAASILSVHNLAHQKQLMSEMRLAICSDTFPEWVKKYVEMNYNNGRLPNWAGNAFSAVGIDVTEFVGEGMKEKVEKSSRHDQKESFVKSK